MIYDSNDNHIIVKALKDKGFDLFNVMYARPSFINGINSGWWVDIAPAYGTDFYEINKEINNKYLGINLKEAMKNIKNIKNKR